jgi:hypothetical protein
MAGGFAEYVRECLGEVPNAFRPGMVAVTLLGNLVLAAGLYSGWHLSAFTAFQLSTAAAAIASLEIILIPPYRLWKTNRATIDELRQRIITLEQDRGRASYPSL